MCQTCAPMSATSIPAAVKDAWDLGDAPLEPISVGLINRTLVASRTTDRIVLQRLHPIFAAPVNLDIDAITAHLAKKGVTTPRLVKTRGGALWVEAEDGVWRALTWIPGKVVATSTGHGMARSAGALVARFHRAVADLQHTFAFTRPGAHDTSAHLAHLDAILVSHDDHDLFRAVRPVGEEILEHGRALPRIPLLPTRIVHGDLKLTNIVFDDALESAVALVDLDTLSHGSIAIELGDALRSWCNAGGESDERACLDQEMYGAAIRGYAVEAKGLLTREEVGALTAGTETVTLELAARFCADALEESYFGWDSSRYRRRGQHCLVRARSALSLAVSIRAAREELQAMVDQAFAGT